MFTLPAICPYCGESVEVDVDPSGGPHQQYVEDCPVCCRPWDVVVVEMDVEEWSVALRTSDQ